MTWGNTTLAEVQEICISFLAPKEIIIIALLQNCVQIILTYTVEPLYKGQVRDGSFVPSTVEPLYKGQVGDGSFVPSTAEPLYKGQVLATSKKAKSDPFLFFFQVLHMRSIAFRFLEVARTL